MKRKILCFVITVLMLLAAASCGISGGGKGAAADYSKVPRDAEDIDPDKIPQDAVNVLYRFYSWYSDWDHDQLYDCNKAADSNILKCILGNGSCFDFEAHGMPGPEYHWGETDPRNWKDILGDYCQGYKLFDADCADRAAKEIFHVSDRDLEKLIQKGEENKDFYRVSGTDGKEYYCSMIPGGVGDNMLDVEILKVKYDGDKHYIVFRMKDMFFGSGDVTEPRYVVMDISDEGFWTLYYHSREIPEVFGL